MKNFKKKYITLGIVFLFSLCIFTPVIFIKNTSIKIESQEEFNPKTNALEQTLLHFYDFEGDTVGQDPTGLTLSVIEPAGSGTANVDNLGDVQQNHVAVYKSGGDQRVELRDNISYYGNSFSAGVFHCKIYHDDSLFGILFHDDIGTLFRLDWFDGIIGRWSPYAEYTTYNYNQWYDVVVYFNISLGWMFEIDGVRFGDGYAYPFEHTGSGGLTWIRWCSAFSGGGNGFFRVDDIAFYYYNPSVSELRNYNMIEDYTYSWIDASGGIELTLNDDGYSTQSLPFEFQFYNDTFSTIYLGANGYLSFVDSSPNDYSNDPIPSADLDNYYLIAPFWDDLYPPLGGHIYVQSFGSYLVAEWLDIYHINGPLVGSFEVILYDTGEIIFNYDYIDYTSGGYTCGLNLGMDTEYYNSYQGLTASTDDFSLKFYLEPFEHDLSVSLKIPVNPEIGNSYMINATVTNSGLNDEYDVDLFLYLDDVIVGSTIISYLPVGTSETISYMWIPPDYEIYNFTVYALPVPDETFTANNFVTKMIYIVESQLFDGMCTNYIFTYLDTYIGSSHFSYSYSSGYIFQGNWWFNLEGYDYNCYYDVDSTTRIMTNLGGDLFFMEGHHDPGWIFTETYLGDNIPIAIGIFGEEHIFNVSDDLIYDLPGYGLVEVWVLVDLTVPGGIAWYEKSTGILLKGTFFGYSGSDNYVLDFVDTNVIFEYIIFDHDLRVSLETPVNPEIGNSYIINATVTNIGLNDEYDVDLFLYLDDVIVSSTTISSLPVGTSETINYIWTPTEVRTYNFTAYSHPIDDEEYTDNNIKTKILFVLFTGKMSGPVAIFRNNLAWDMNTTELILNMYGIDYSVYNSSNMGIVDLSPFEKVIIESDQDQLFYDTLGNYISWFENYAATGGILEIHACDGGWQGGLWDGLYLMPGGFDQNHGLINDISINLTYHPIVNNPYVITEQGLYGWTLGYFSTFPSSSKQIMIDSSTLNPVFIELDYLEGTILITMQGLEWGYYHGYSKLLENVILYNPDAIMVTAPDSSSQWETGTSEEITWISTGTISDVKIELYKDDVFVMEIVASTPNDGEFYWTIPFGLDDSDQYQIKFSDVLKPSTYDFGQYFEIFNPTITLTAPDSLTAWEIGTSQNITWTSRGTISDVKIELYKDGVFVMEIVASTPNDGSYTWVIPTDLEDGIDYQIKISDVSNPATYDESPNFAITSAEIPGDGAIPSYNLYIVIGTICIVSVILLKKRFKLIK